MDSEEDSEDESPRGSPHKGEGGNLANQEPRYTPDWESDSDSDGDSSSTSGEFMWKVSGGGFLYHVREWNGMLAPHTLVLAPSMHVVPRPAW